MMHKPKKKTELLSIITALGVIAAMGFSLHQAYLLQKNFESESRPWLAVKSSSESMSKYIDIFFRKIDLKKIFVFIEITPETHVEVKIPIVFQNIGNQPAQITAFETRLINTATNEELLKIIREGNMTVPSNNEEIPYILTLPECESINDAQPTPKRISESKLLYKTLKTAVDEGYMRVELIIKYRGVKTEFRQPYNTMLTFDIPESDDYISIIEYKMN